LLLPTPPSAPQNLQAVAGDGQVTLTWDPPSDDGGAPILLYTIYRGTSSGEESFLIAVPLITTYIDLTVSNGVTYYYQVSATNAVGEGPRSNEASATPNPPATVPGAPQGLGATAGDATIALVWSPPSSDGGSPITNYRIYRGTSSGGESFHIEIGNVLAYSDTSLTNGVTYFYKVSAVNAVGEGPMSTEASATPTALPTVPGAPRNLQATPGDGQVALTWQAPSDDGGSPILLYTIYRGTTSGGESFLITVPLVTTYTDATVTNGVTYYYQVSATNAIGEGPLSSEVSATPNPPAGPPSAPQGLSATPGDATVTLTWSAPSSDGGSPITNYKIFRGTSSNGETLLTTIGNVLTYTDTAVTNGVTYYYKVSAVNSVGEGPRSNEASATPVASTTVPGAPRDLGAVAGDATVALAWSSPASDGGSAITNYKVYRGTISGQLSLLATLPNVLSYTDSAVTNGQTYYYKVTAVNAVGEGPRSNEASGTPTSSQTVPSPPRQLSATPGDAQITLTWLAPSSDGGSPITNYRIYRGPASGGESLLTTIGSEFSYSDTTVTNGLAYYYFVKAVNGIGEGGSSNEVAATPVAGPSVPDAPRSLVATPGNGTITLTWSPPSSDGRSPITGYTVYRGTNSGNRSFSVPLGNVSTYTDTGLSNGQRYYYVVTAVNAIGEGPPSSEKSAKPATVPDAPGNLRAIPGNGNVTIQWSGAANNGAPVTNYRVYRGTTSGSTSLLTTVGNVDTYTNTGLTNGVRYYYRVAAVNNVGEGPKSNEASASPTGGPSVPGVPRSLAATAGSGVVTLRWSAPATDGGSPIKNYTIYRGVSRDSLEVLARASALSLFDGGLTNGVTYYYEVTATNAIGEGPRSAQVPATPKASGVGADTTKPSIQILSPVAGASLPAGPTVVTGNASDNVGLASVEVSTDGLNWSKASGTASWTATINLTEGDHTIYARATDGAQNMETATVSVTVSADGGTGASGGDLQRSLIVTAVLSFAVSAGIAWFLLDRRRKKSRRPMGSRRFRVGRNP
jgi:fibronectin type 3 domain-containing protein